jgi:hypothetical protein
VLDGEGLQLGLLDRATLLGVIQEDGQNIS